MASPPDNVQENSNSTQNARRTVLDFFSNTGEKVEQKSDSVSAAKKPYDRDDIRSIRSDWFKLFPWLELVDGKFYCSLCQQARRKNVFVTGKSTSKPKKDDLLKHEKTGDHR